MPSPQLATIVEMLRSANPLEGGTLLEKRARMELQSRAVAPPADVRYQPVTAGGVPAGSVPAGDVPAEWTTAPGARSDRALVYFHGGGYCLGSIATHRAHVARLSRETRMRVLSVGYRLAPEHPHPAAVEDAVAAYRFVLAQGLAPQRVAFAGDSAGGGLVVAALVALRDAGLPLPAAGACISPWTDLTNSGDSVTTKAAEDPMVTPADLHELGAAYLAGGNARAPTASPLFAELRGLPPLLLQVGSAEVLLDDSTRLAEAAHRAGCEVELRIWNDMIHVWHVFADLLPEGAEAMRELAEFVAKRVGYSSRAGP